MADYSITTVTEQDRILYAQVESLLHKEGIRRDTHLDYTAAMLDEEYNVIATGSCYGNTLRCLAVDSGHQGEALMNAMVSHLVEYQYGRGNTHLFLYTKCSTAGIFATLGFTEIERVAESNLVFMENRQRGFQDYLEKLRQETVEQGGEEALGKNAAAVIMNANPFTLGHQYLAEQAAASTELLHLFIVSEDQSLFPFAVRRKLVMEGCRHIPNIVFHDCGSYLISATTFPAYFQKSEQDVIQGQAILDLKLFVRIAEALSIQARFVGEEPSSVVTGCYNDIMSRELPAAGIACNILTRRKSGEEIISASTVREALKAGDWEQVQRLVPETTLRFLRSPEAEEILERIRSTQEVRHY